MTVLRLATEGEAARIARESLERSLKLAATDAARGEELDEAIAAARRACDEAEKALRGRRRGRSWDEIVDEIYRRAHDPWIPLRIGTVELVSLRMGSYATVIGGEGGGKSSFVMQILAQHERDAGPAIYVTPELDADEAGARAICQDRCATWPDVLKGLVPRNEVVSHPRLRILEREDATHDLLRDEVKAMRDEHGNLPILCAWDYLQASPGDDDGERMRVAKVSSGLRRLAKQLGVVLIGVSQSSRDGAKKLDSGELLGAEASRTGAESAQIERDSYVTISLGDRQRREDGTESRSISLGKNRMGAGDIVFPGVYEGRTGRWTLEDVARPAAEVRAEREGRDESKKVGAVELAMLKAAEQSTGPLTRDQLREIAATKKDYARLAIANLLARGDLVEVSRKQPRSRSFMLWTAARAKEHGVALVTLAGGQE